MEDEEFERALAAWEKQRPRISSRSTSDGFLFRGKFYGQPAMKALLEDDFAGFCSLEGTDFTEITPTRNGQPLKGVELEQSLNSYKATWRKAFESSG
jgi:hypothetical protein